MNKTEQRSCDIKDFIVENIYRANSDVVKATSDYFSISRQAVSRHIKKLIDQKVVTMGGGKTKSVRYSLPAIFEWRKTLSLADNPHEDIVWRNEISNKLENLPPNALNIWNHGFSEMLNNAIDHSGSETVSICITQNAYSTEMNIIDYGVGIFKKIKDAMHLLDERQAVIELTKGKLTTDPTRHSGEGIFFSSRMFDEFFIFSGEVFLSHIYDRDEDWILENQKYISGTFITMKMRNNTTRTAQEIFDKFTDEENDYGFTKTVVPVRLAKYGNEQLVSRSQAKRLLLRVDSFKTVLFDFKDVETIGQAFADEVFRVFAGNNPGVEIIPINHTDAVLQMVKHVRHSR